jgi:ribokinase
VNLDLSILMAAPPSAGETVLGSERRRGLGGKGANQAVAAARAGASAAFLGAFGDDADSGELRTRLFSTGVDIRWCETVPGAASGFACILISTEGESRIIYVPGANAALDPGFVQDRAQTLAAAAVVVLQAETPPAAIRAAIDVAARAGVRIVLNLAPVMDLGDALTAADPLVVNAVEASQLTGLSLATPDEVAAAAPRLAGLARSVVVTLGARGALVIEGAVAARVEAPAVHEVRDTTGAGDAFVGVLATRLAAGDPLLAAAQAAVRCASATVSSYGAAESYPDFAAILAEVP